MAQIYSLGGVLQGHIITNPGMKKCGFHIGVIIIAMGYDTMIAIDFNRNTKRYTCILNAILDKFYTIDLSSIFFNYEASKSSQLISTMICLRVEMLT